MSESKPPMYFTIEHALNVKNGSGNPDLHRREAAERMRKFILEESEYRVENRQLWNDFLKEYPEDTTAIFVVGERTHG